MNAGAQPALGWAQTINGLVKAGKVKQDEVEWSGVMDWLKLQGKKVPREALIGFLDSNGVQVEETVLSSGDPFDKIRDDYMRAMVAQGATASAADQMFREMLAFARDRDHSEQLKDRGFAMVMKDGNYTGNELHDAVNYPDGDAKYGQYQLPGGTNYREVLLTLPEKEPSFALDDYIGELNDKYGRKEISPNHFVPGWEAHELTPEEREKLGRLNVLAHIRLNDRTDADGKKVLFVEELQSDFGQDTKKQKTIIGKAVDDDFEGIVDRMKKAGVLTVECD